MFSAILYAACLKKQTLMTEYDYDYHTIGDNEGAKNASTSTLFLYTAL